MTGPEGTGTISPNPSQETEGLAAPGVFDFYGLNETFVSLRLIETYKTPEGYDVSNPQGARAYLAEVHGYDLADIRTSRDADEALADVERVAIYADGRHQNDKEHTEHLWELIEQSSPDWSLRDRYIGKRFARVHDWPEIFGRDTGINDKQGLATKFYREEAGITLLVEALGYNHPDIQAMLKYHGKLPMSDQERLIFNRVHGFDKVEPYVFQYEQGAILHIDRQEKLERIARQALPKLVLDPTAFREGQAAIANLGKVMLAKDAGLVEGNPLDIVAEISRETIAEHEKRVLEHIRKPNLWGPPSEEPLPYGVIDLKQHKEKAAVLRSPVPA